ncbi:hypothetical protein ASZ90_017188 [hydrocarbon metagenome]|uniref:Uncharacterized protein n=1 Tax=hydrocarbon metagenome TaxID=938273 RepID=A0A0W8E9P5_9ZZZZ
MPHYLRKSHAIISYFIVSYTIEKVQEAVYIFKHFVKGQTFLKRCFAFYFKA